MQVFKRLLGLFVGLPVVLVLGVFIVSNAHPVEWHFWVLGVAFSLPAFVLPIMLLLLGILVGGIIIWLRPRSR